MFLPIDQDFRAIPLHNSLEDIKNIQTEIPTNYRVLIVVSEWNRLGIVTILQDATFFRVIFSAIQALVKKFVI